MVEFMERKVRLAVATHSQMGVNEDTETERLYLGQTQRLDGAGNRRYILHSK